MTGRESMCMEGRGLYEQMLAEYDAGLVKTVPVED